ncbi:MAG: hypothetical protein AAFX99_16315 [Myxococcota bacterium]
MTDWDLHQGGAHAAQVKYGHARLAKPLGWARATSGVKEQPEISTLGGIAR